MCRQAVTLELHRHVFFDLNMHYRMRIEEIEEIEEMKCLGVDAWGYKGVVSVACLFK